MKKITFFLIIFFKISLEGNAQEALKIADLEVIQKAIFEHNDISNNDLENIIKQNNLFEYDSKEKIIYLKNKKNREDYEKLQKYRNCYKQRINSDTIDVLRNGVKNNELNISDRINKEYDRLYNKNIDWLKAWFNKDSANYRLNPFEYEFADYKKKKEELNLNLAFLKEDLKYFEKRIDHPNNTLENFEKLFTELKTQKANIQQKTDELNKIINAEKYWEEKSIEKTAYYKFSDMPLSNNEKLRWVSSYDASNKLELIKPKINFKNRFEKPYSLNENDEMIIAIHNIDKTTTIEITGKEHAHEVISKLEEEVIFPISKTIIESKAAVPSSSININKEVLKKLEWLENQTNPYFEYKLKTNKVPLFRTEAFYPEKKLPNLENGKTITITSKNKLDTNSVKLDYFKYKITHFLPFMGISYIPKSRINAVYDESSGNFNTDRFYNNIDVIVGAKWYPWGINRSWDRKTAKYISKSNFSKYNMKIGNHWTNRLSTSIGLGVSKQFLRNYYVGIGWDPIPGVNLQIGGNLYFKNIYSIQNSKIIDQSLKPALTLYYGLTLDLAIANQISKSLIKIK